MEDKDVLYKEMLKEVLKTMAEGEKSRNKLFEKALYVFLATALGLAICFSFTLYVLFVNMFVK